MKRLVEDAIAAEPKARVLDVLARVLPADALAALVDEHVRRIALGAFTWQQGAYRIALDRRASQLRVPVRVTIGDAIVRGILLTESIEGLRAAAPDDARFAHAPGSAYQLDELRLLPDEKSVVAAMDGTKTISDLQLLFGHVPERSLRGLAAGLLCVHLVRFVGRGPARVRNISYF